MRNCQPPGSGEYSPLFHKLSVLDMPDLTGKEVLDIGCDTGFFSGYASFRDAAKVTGIDINPDAVAAAREFFPQCEFICQDWASLDGRKYDVILFLGGLEGIKDQGRMLDFLMERLKPGGFSGSGDWHGRWGWGCLCGII